MLHFKVLDFSDKPEVQFCFIFRKMCFRKSFFKATIWDLIKRKRPLN